MICCRCEVDKEETDFCPSKVKDKWCRACSRAYANSRREKDALIKYKSNIMRNFGVTLEFYDYTLKTQNGGCAICKGVNANGERLAIDHCHETGRVRGLLCSNCNLGLGYFKDDLERLASASMYLKSLPSVKGKK